MCERAGIPNFVEKLYVSEWEIDQVVHILEVARAIAWKERDPFKFETRWSLNGNTGKQIKMIEQNVRNEIKEGKKQNNQGTKLLVVWIWSDGTNDERARVVCTEK